MQRYKVAVYYGPEEDQGGAKMWVLVNQKNCTPKKTIRISVSVPFNFVGVCCTVQSEFFLKFSWFLNVLNRSIPAL
jgi:hypothetical protein